MNERMSFAVCPLAFIEVRNAASESLDFDFMVRGPKVFGGLSECERQAHFRPIA